MRLSTIIRIGQAMYYLGQLMSPPIQISMPPPPVYKAPSGPSNNTQLSSHLDITSRITLPTTKETLEELKRRLGKELYRMELDLMSGGRIAGKPCDCLSAKHTFGLEATAEELMAYEKNSVYQEIIDWLKAHRHVFEPAEIANHPAEFYIGLVPEVRNFRKRVMGTDSAGVLLNEEEKKQVRQKALEILNRTLEAEEKPVSISS